jgi:hypothetical protein
MIPLSHLVTLSAPIWMAAMAPPTDYALVEHREAWLHHPVLGDPSWDTFTRAPENPVHRGAPPHEWPVNGFLFEDPVSGDWFLYAGHYPYGYAINPDAPMRCTVFRSSDLGATWAHLGPVFAPGEHVFKGEVSPMHHAPDVSVTYDGGRYHMCFDWLTKNTTWDNVANPPADANSGVGYAWADKPEGPFHVTPRPVATTREQTPLVGKYRRLSASTLVRRASDWIVLTLTDSGPWFGWALTARTSERPEGPYSEPVLLMHPESLSYLPPLLEYFPAFVHEGHVNAPATSVALNRNYQALFRAPLEQADDPAGWEAVQYGSLWHAEPVENEAWGIWGQTFSGFVGDDGMLRVMCPGVDQNGMGTLNIASRPWSEPLRERGFVISGHRGPSLALLRRGGEAMTRLEAALELHGTVTVFWNHTAPLGADRVASDAAPHPLSLAGHTGVTLEEDRWALVSVGTTSQREVIAEGPREAGQAATLTVAWEPGGRAKLTVDGTEVWSGEGVPAGPGQVGLLAAPGSHTRVNRFLLSGDQPVASRFLWTDALLGAAQNMKDWEPVESGLFGYGTGVVSRSDAARAKWNVEGSRLVMHAPKGPGYGSTRLWLDGTPVGTISFTADVDMPSSPVWDSGPLTPGPHALVIESEGGPVPLDCLGVEGMIEGDGQGG